jgi:DNA-binding transcriptional MerR regulator
MTWKVGDIAARTGLSVRTLHHYEEIGLLRPSGRSAAGHRLYSAGDCARLQRIVSLRQLGFGLEAIRDCLSSPDFSPLELIERHRAWLQEQVARQQALIDRLDGIAAHLRRGEEVSAAEFLETIEEMIMFEKYYTPEQLEKLKQRADAVGEDAVRDAEAAWQKLFADARVEMDKGTNPKDPAVAPLAARMRELIEAFTGGDAGIERSLGNLYANEPGAAARFGVDTEACAFLQRALE